MGNGLFSSFWAQNATYEVVFPGKPMLQYYQGYKNLYYFGRYAYGNDGASGCQHIG